MFKKKNTQQKKPQPVANKQKLRKEKEKKKKNTKRNDHSPEDNSNLPTMRADETPKSTMSVVRIPQRLGGDENDVNMSNDFFFIFSCPQLVLIPDCSCRPVCQKVSTALRTGSRRQVCGAPERMSWRWQARGDNYRMPVNTFAESFPGRLTLPRITKMRK